MTETHKAIREVSRMALLRHRKKTDIIVEV